MRVAIVLDRFPVPSQTFVRRHIGGLLARGCTVDVFAAVGDGPPPAADGLTVRYRNEGLGALTALDAALRAPKRRLWADLSRAPARSFEDLAIRAHFTSTARYDVVHAHFGPMGLLARRAQRRGLLAAPLVVSFHGYDVHVLPRARGPTVYRPLFAHAARFLANTRFTADALRSLGCPSDRLQVLPVGLRIPTDVQLRSELGQPPRVLCVARLVEKKGIPVLLRALASLRARPWVLDLAGEGPLRDELHQLARHLDIGPRVRFLGACAEAETMGLMRSADLFVLASVTASDGDMEGQGLVLQEAQALGLPVVTTRHNGLPEGMVDGETGFIVPEDDPEALAGAIARLMDDHALRDRMKAEAVAFVRRRYDIEAITDRMLALYRTIRATERPPSASLA